jgi:hypothetical protein
MFGFGIGGLTIGCSVTLDPTLIPPALGRGEGGSVFLDASAAIEAASLGTPDARAADGLGFADNRLPETCVLVQASPSEYLVCTQPTTQGDAAADCASRGATLAAIGSADENAFLYAQALLFANSNLWLGGTRDDAQLWSWPDGSSFWAGRYDGMAVNGGYTNWKSGEPNNSSTVTTDPERCMVMTLTDGGWNDRACTLDLAYICERPLRTQ